MIPVYNRTQYLERALKSVLQQDPGSDEMQIEVVDDCSTQGNPEQVVNRIGQGRVAFYRQPAHTSMSANWNACIERARGRWVHILHDDDMVLPGFYQAYRRFIEGHPEVVLVFSPVIFVDEADTWTQIVRFNIAQTTSGLVENPILELVKVDFICAAAAVVARDAYEMAGGFATPLSYSADWDMWLRIARAGPLGYITHPYALYRDHARSHTMTLARSGENIEEVLRTIQVGIRMLHPRHQQEARAAAYRNYSRYANIMRRQLHTSRNHAAALFHAWWAFRLHPSGRNVLHMLQSALLAAKGVSCRC
jgi:GT2 family glycosyltransferase